MYHLDFAVLYHIQPFQHRGDELLGDLHPERNGRLVRTVKVTSRSPQVAEFGRNTRKGDVLLVRIGLIKRLNAVQPTFLQRRTFTSAIGTVGRVSVAIG